MPTSATVPNVKSELSMASPLYNASIPVLQQMLRALSDVLKKAEDHATQKISSPMLFCRRDFFPTCFR